MVNEIQLVIKLTHSMHLLDFESTTSLSTLLLQWEEVPFELELIGKKVLLITTIPMKRFTKLLEINNREFSKLPIM